VALYGIYEFMDLLILNLPAKLGWKTWLIVLDSCRRLDATSPQSPNSRRETSAISHIVAMLLLRCLFQ
jgi:hypothetical protein